MDSTKTKYPDSFCHEKVKAAKHKTFCEPNKSYVLYYIHTWNSDLDKTVKYFGGNKNN